jgi:hypothetical protein
LLFYIFGINQLSTEIKLNNITGLVRTAQLTHVALFVSTSQLMLYREIIAVFSEIHTKSINTLCGQNVEWDCNRTDSATVYIRFVYCVGCY